MDAVVAVTPATSLVAALGLAGGGYLDGREDIAACGAVVGAFGLAVERMQTRRVRVRLRRARADHRSDMQEVTRLLHEMQRDLADLRTDLDDVRAERDAVRAELLATQHAAVPGPLAPSASVASPVPVVPSVLAVAEPVPATAWEVAPDEDSRIDLTADRPVPVEVPAEVPIEVPVEVPAGLSAEPPAEPQLPRLPLSLILPGQVRSPIATGGIPLLAPGPSVPVRPVPERRATRPDRFGSGLRDNRDDDTQPLPVLTAELADALVYAAMAEADAAELTRSLDTAGEAGQPALLHAGDAHHAGDYARRQGDLLECGQTPTLYVVRRGKHVA